MSLLFQTVALLVSRHNFCSLRDIHNRLLGVCLPSRSPCRCGTCGMVTTRCRGFVSPNIETIPQFLVAVKQNMERTARIERAFPVWKTGTWPLCQARFEKVAAPLRDRDFNLPTICRYIPNFTESRPRFRWPNVYPYRGVLACNKPPYGYNCHMARATRSLSALPAVVVDHKAKPTSLREVGEHQISACRDGCGSRHTRFPLYPSWASPFLSGLWSSL